MQFHDDDVVPEMETLSPEQIRAHAREMRQRLEDQGLAAEFVAPRLWEHPNTIDGAFTANDAQVRQWAIERGKRTVDIINELGAA